MEYDNKYSKGIEAFLDFLVRAQKDHESSQCFLKEQEDLQQDILHKFEFVVMTYHQNAKLGRMATENRQERRQYKKTAEVTRPIAEFAQKNKNFINQMRNLLGEVRKIEKKQGSRAYAPKVMTWDDYFGKGEGNEDLRKQCPEGGAGRG